MSNLKPLESLNAPDAEPLAARRNREVRRGWLVLVIVLVLAFGGAGAGALALMLVTPAAAPRPAVAEALENHLRKAGVLATLDMTRPRQSHARA